MGDQTEDANAKGFSSHWLTLREPADHTARSMRLTQSLIDWRERFSNFNVMDLGAGTASNLRFLCPKLGFNQQWILLDNDANLLRKIPTQLQQWCEKSQYNFDQLSTCSARLQSRHFQATVSWKQSDLSKHLSTLDLTQTQLVTGSALLDLTSSHWLSELATMINCNHCASLFVLSYNGQIHWLPAHEYDQKITHLLNAHQLSDKGFGNALGPGAQAYFQSLFDTTHIMQAPADWNLNNQSLELQTALIKDWMNVAAEQSPQAKRDIKQWSEQRGIYIKSQSSQLQVGHTDILTLPSTQTPSQ